MPSHAEQSYTRREAVQLGLRGAAGLVAVRQGLIPLSGLAQEPPSEGMFADKVYLPYVADQQTETPPSQTIEYRVANANELVDSMNRMWELTNGNPETRYSFVVEIGEGIHEISNSMTAILPEPQKSTNTPFVTKVGMHFPERVTLRGKGRKEEGASPDPSKTVLRFTNEEGQRALIAAKHGFIMENMAIIRDFSYHPDFDNNEINYEHPRASVYCYGDDGSFGSSAFYSLGVVIRDITRGLETVPNLTEVPHNFGILTYKIKDVIIDNTVVSGVHNWDHITSSQGHHVQVTSSRVEHHPHFALNSGAGIALVLAEASRFAHLQLEEPRFSVRNTTIENSWKAMIVLAHNPRDVRSARMDVGNVSYTRPQDEYDVPSRWLALNSTGPVQLDNVTAAGPVSNIATAPNLGAGSIYAHGGAVIYEDFNFGIGDLGRRPFEPEGVATTDPEDPLIPCLI